MKFDIRERNLNDVDMMILESGICPNCFRRIEVSTEQTEEELYTISGICPICDSLFMADQSPSGENLGGHE